MISERAVSKFGLPVGYIERSAPVYFDDAPFLGSDIIHQPEVYDAADYILQADRRTTCIDIGCGNGRKLRSVRAERHVGIDFGANLAVCRQHHGSWGEWIETDLSRAECVALSRLADHRAVVVCADVIEHLPDPEAIVALLAACYQRGAIVLTSTPDRIRTRGAGHAGPPPNPSHVREWALEEYAAFLAARGLPATYAGYTLNNNITRELKTIVTLHDAAVDLARGPATGDRPVAIVSTYNEADVIDEVGQDIIDQGCDLVAIDNWSSDGTWDHLADLAARHPAHVSCERFPADGPRQHSAWRDILRRKETLARAFPGRWIIHMDADELRRSPFVGLRLAEALHVAQRTGANRVSFNLVNFRPIDDRPFRPGTLRSGFSHFEFGTKSGHFLQAKAWLQGNVAVDLASSGGHVAAFPGTIDFRYRFLLLHYPIRSAAHGRHKVLSDRRDRWSPEERALGLHSQYDGLSDASSFQWSREALHPFGPDFWREHGLALMADIPERRLVVNVR